MLHPNFAKKLGMQTAPAPGFWRWALVSLLLCAVCILAASYALPAYAGGCDPECLTHQRIGRDCSQCGNQARDVSTVANNLGDMLDTSGHVIVIISAIGGMVVSAVSLYSLYKSTRDERNKPIGGVVGLVAGGLMCSIALLLWVMQNTFLGAAASAAP